jgi:methyl-accepting chemotaxis protein
MADRTFEQINESLDRLLSVSGENTRNIAELQAIVSQVAGAVEQLATLTDSRLNQQDARIARQDQLIQLLSTYITGVPPVEDAGESP